MNTPKKVKIQALESLDDLDVLIRGDALKIVFQYESWRSSHEGEELGAYHGRSNSDQFQFVIPAIMSDEYIIMYRARRSQMKARDGKVILNEDKSVTDSFSQSHRDYVELNKTLIQAGLR